MSIHYVMRQWSCEHGFPPRALARWERRMSRLSARSAGTIPLVRQWYIGGGRYPWYVARAGREERELRQWCAREFGSGTISS